MPVGDADTDLTAMRTKFRRMAKTPSSNQITDEQIDDYLNWFYLYSLPEELRMFDLKTNYSFYTEKNRDKYTFPVNSFVSIEPPSYISGFESFYSQSQEEFYRIYPKNQDIQVIGSGDGTAGPYNLTLSNAPVIRGCVGITSTDGAGNTVTFRDDPNNISSDTGSLFIAEEDGTLGTAVGTIIYSTGVVSITTNPINLQSGADITGEAVPFTASRPTAILFFDNHFVLRPVPDKGYKVELAAFAYPTQLINSNQNPLLRQWWEMLSMGGVLKFFTDTRQIEAYKFYKPLYDEQERLAQRKTLKILQSQRSQTIYTEQSQTPQNNFWNYF